MQETLNYKLNKPELTDSADITKISENFDIIDNALLDVEAKTITYTPFCVNNGSIDSEGNENILYFDDATGSQEIEFIQPVITENGTLNGNHFAVSGYSDLWKAFDNDPNTFINETTTQLNVDIYNPTPILLKSMGLTTTIALDCKATIFVRNEGEWQAVGTYPLRSINGGVEQVYTVNNLTEKYKYIRLRLETDGEYETFRISRIRIGGVVTESIVKGSTLLKFRSGITATGTNRKTFKLDSIAPFDVSNFTTNLYTVYVNELGTVELLHAPIIQKHEPSNVVDGVVWVRALEPFACYVYRSGVWTAYNGIPIGNVHITDGTITSVVTLPYNQNGYSVNTQSVATASTFGVVRVAEESVIDCGCVTDCITPKSLYKVMNLRRKSTNYSLNDSVGVAYRNDVKLVCKQAGTTNSDPLETSVINDMKYGDQITDGSIVWEVRPIAQGITSINDLLPDASGNINLTDLIIDIVYNMQGDILEAYYCTKVDGVAPQGSSETLNKGQIVDGSTLWDSYTTNSGDGLMFTRTDDLSGQQYELLSTSCGYRVGAFDSGNGHLDYSVTKGKFRKVTV